MRKKRNRRLFFLLLLLALSGVVLLGYIFYPKNLNLNIVFSTIPPVYKYKYFSQLNGEGVMEAAQQTPTVVGVMVDNFPTARPQFCLNSLGNIVYEAPVEGGMTRFMVVSPIFTTTVSGTLKLGPVRSARPYYLDWIGEYGQALYLHCGGSSEALSLLKDINNVIDINEFYNGQYFWRDNSRLAPHNLFTSSANWEKLGEKYNLRGANHWVGWKFSKNTIVGELVNKISLTYAPDYVVSWSYIGEEKYERYINGELHQNYCNSEALDSITAQNILLQFSDVEVIDDYGRKKIRTTGVGDALVLRSGQLIRGTWKKNIGEQERTRFYDRDGVEIILYPGTTWVEIVPIGTKIEVTS